MNRTPKNDVIHVINARIDNILEEQQRIWRYYQERILALETRLDNLVDELAGYERKPFDPKNR